MAPPGKLEARYEALAGNELQRLEAYVARTKLGFEVSEWRALPWWKRRLYLEQMEAEHEREQEAFARARGGEESQGGPSTIADALLTGTMDDVGRLGFG